MNFEDIESIDVILFEDEIKVEVTFKFFNANASAIEGLMADYKKRSEFHKKYRYVKKDV